MAQRSRALVALTEVRHSDAYGVQPHRTPVPGDLMLSSSFSGYQAHTWNTKHTHTYKIKSISHFLIKKIIEMGKRRGDCFQSILQFSSRNFKAQFLEGCLRWQMIPGTKLWHLGSSFRPLAMLIPPPSVSQLWKGFSQGTEQDCSYLCV